MLIIALVLAVIGLAALVFAVVTSNELVAWVCIGASLLGVVLLIIDALQERRRRKAGSTGGHQPVTESVAVPVSGPAAEPARPRHGTVATDTPETATGENFYVDYPEDAGDEPTDSDADAETPRGETGTVADEQSGTSADSGRSETFSDDPNTRS